MIFVWDTEKKRFSADGLSLFSFNKFLFQFSYPRMNLVGIKGKQNLCFQKKYSVKSCNVFLTCFQGIEQEFAHFLAV